MLGFGITLPVFLSEEERIRYFRYNVDKYIEYEKEVYKILIDLL